METWVAEVFLKILSHISKIIKDIPRHEIDFIILSSLAILIFLNLFLKKHGKKLSNEHIDIEKILKIIQDKLNELEEKHKLNSEDIDELNKLFSDLSKNTDISFIKNEYDIKLIKEKLEYIIEEMKKFGNNNQSIMNKIERIIDMLELQNYRGLK